MNYGGLFEPEKKQKRIEELETLMNNPNFWNDKKNSEKVISELNNLKKVIGSVNDLKEKIKNNLEMLEELKVNNDLELQNIIELEKSEIETELENLEISILLDEPYDSLNAILELHSGAGGTEACDWVAMLYRMYTRWCEKKNYKIEILDIQDGDEAGIKSLSVIIKGINAYGYLKCEKGIHRLD